MRSQTPDEVESIFQEALDLAPSERSAFLERRCAGDVALQREVESLIAHAESDVTSLLRTRLANAVKTAADVNAGDTISDRYRLCRVLGEGGLGIVWLAEQTIPVRREVALKIVRLGMDSKEVIGRFEAERNALSLMNHPGIAKVHDAGITDRGRPYFVMELVRGVPITKFCDDERLTTRQRLQLFQTVCNAVQHAHQKGVIHRDLKPSNILVELRDGQPVAKVIDFGIAKATAQKLTERTIFTMEGQLIGTPEYMSPEQAEASAVGVDSTSDIYSLGVVLYELLTGTLPFDPNTLRSAGLSGFARIIREQDPARPSTRLSTLGAAGTAIGEHRRTDLRALRRDLAGDLDWIVMKAMEKERTRRYASASELSADIARHLNHEPVLAGPPTAKYRLGKFVRRNRAAVTWAALVAIVLIGGVTATIVQAVRATNAEHETRTALAKSLRETDRAKASLDFLKWGLGLGSRSLEGEKDLTMRETLDLAAGQIKGRFEGRPEAEADVRWLMGMVYGELGAYPAAREQFVIAVPLLEDLYRVDPSANSRQLMETLVYLCVCERELDKGEAASAYWYWRAADICEERLRTKSPALADALADMRGEIIGGKDVLVPENPPAPGLMERHLSRVKRLYEAEVDPNDPVGGSFALYLCLVATGIGNQWGTEIYREPYLGYLRTANAIVARPPVGSVDRLITMGLWMEARNSVPPGQEDHRVEVARDLVRRLVWNPRQYWMTIDANGILGDALLQQGHADKEEEIVRRLIESHQQLWKLASPDNQGHKLLMYRRAFAMWRLAGMGLGVDNMPRTAVQLIDRPDVLNELGRGVEQMTIPEVLGMIADSMGGREDRSDRWYEIARRAGGRAAELPATQSDPSGD